MSIDFNEARAIVEAAKKRGAIRGPGGGEAPASAPQAPPKGSTTEFVLPEWLKNELTTPTSGEKSSAPVWRSP